MTDSVMYSDLCWPDIKQAIELNTIVILPVGSTEQHAFHLPICTDDYMAQKWAYDSAVLAKEKYGVKVLVLPGVHVGNSKHHMGLPGTLTLSFETLKNVVFEIGDSVLTHGFKKLLILNVHGGNRFAVGAAGIDLKEKYRNLGKDVIIRVGDDGDPDLRPMSMFDKLESFTEEAKIHKMVHGGVLETAKMLYLRKDLVKMDRAKKIDTPPLKQTELEFYDKATNGIGASGRPSDATAEAGQIQWETHVQCLAEYLARLDKLS